MEDRIQALDRQVAVLRKLRECVDQPDGTAGLDMLDLRTGSVAWPALCSLRVAGPAAPRPATGTRSSEAGMTDGIILLVLIAALVAFGVTRARRRLGMGTSNGRTWIVIMAAVILALLGLWAYQSHGRPERRRIGQPTGSLRSGISNQTALPSWVGRDPHRVAS